MVTWLTQSRFRCCQGACRVEQQLASSALLGCLVPSQILYPITPFSSVSLCLLLLRCGSNGGGAHGLADAEHTPSADAEPQPALPFRFLLFFFLRHSLKMLRQALNSQVTRFIGMVYFSFCCFLPTPPCLRPLCVSLLSVPGLLTLVFTLPFGPCVRLLQR